MTYFYSKSAGGFFHSDIHTDIPADAKPITDDEHADLLRAQSRGKRIAADDGGAPVALDQTPPSAAVQARDVRTRRNRLLDESDWIVLRAFEMGEPVPAEWRAYRQKLRDLTDAKKFPKVAEKDWPAAPAEPE